MTARFRQHTDGRWAVQPTDWLRWRSHDPDGCCHLVDESDVTGEGWSEAALIELVQPDYYVPPSPQGTEDTVPVWQLPGLDAAELIDVQMHTSRDLRDIAMRAASAAVWAELNEAPF